MQLSTNQKTFSQFFDDFWNLHKIWNILEKRRALGVIRFWNYRLQKGLLKCLKSPESEHFWTVNMLKGPKECLNLHGRIFAIFFDHSEKKSAQYILF